MQEENTNQGSNAEFYTPEGCFINELSNIDADPEASYCPGSCPSGKNHKMAPYRRNDGTIRVTFRRRKGGGWQYSPATRWSW